jgi:hypothetical protein
MGSDPKPTSGAGAISGVGRALAGSASVKEKAPRLPPIATARVVVAYLIRNGSPGLGSRRIAAMDERA